MTITGMTNYCPTCQEVCWHHPTNCTVCGTALETTPTASASSSNGQGPAAIGGGGSGIPTPTPSVVGGISLIPEALRDEAREASRELRHMLQNIRQQLQQVGQDQQELLTQVQNTWQEWQDVPAALLEPVGNKSNSRPTSKAFLDKIPAVNLKENSSLLFQATLQIESLPEMEGILGDFDVEIKPMEISGHLIIAHPRTGLGGLNADTVKLVQQRTTSNDDKSGVYLLCFERGDGVTFVQKAFMAQSCGAVACIVANHVAEPWPYIMRDSPKEASKNGGLCIPTVMIKESDAKRIWSLDKNNHNKNSHLMAACCLKIYQQSPDCAICTEALTSGSNVMRLPTCGHVFHQACVMPWLNNHNTCPFCRRELPTDDEAYEQERRRQQRTHAGSVASHTNSTVFTEFYG